MRRAVAVVAAVLPLALLAGCGSGPSQVGAAAIVGDAAIPVEHVQDWWDRVLQDPALREQVRDADQLDDLGRVLVTEAVRHELLRAVSERENMDFDEAEVSELIDELGGEQAAIEKIGPSIYDSSTVRERARDQLLAVALGRKYFDRVSVRYDYTSASSREQAIDKANRLAADPENAREIIEADRDAGLDVGIDQEQTIADSIETALGTPLFAVPAGNVLAYPEQNQENPGQWTVAVLHERDTDAAPSSSATATEASQVDRSFLEGIGLRVLAPMARDIGVRVSPRYGVWSDVYLAVMSNEGEIPAVVVPFARSTSD